MFAHKGDIPERMLTTTEVANLFGVHRRTALRWVSDGIIGSWRSPGGHYRIPYSAYQVFRTKFSTLPADEQQQLLSERGNDTMNDDDATGE